MTRATKDGLLLTDRHREDQTKAVESLERMGISRETAEVIVAAVPWKVSKRIAKDLQRGAS